MYHDPTIIAIWVLAAIGIGASGLLLVMAVCDLVGAVRKRRAQTLGHDHG